MMGKGPVSVGAVFWLSASACLISVITLQLKDELLPILSVKASPIDFALGSGIDTYGHSVFRQLNADLLDTIIERPLFSVLRRPLSLPAEIQPEVSKSPIDTLTLTLAGTLLVGKTKIALLTHPTKGLLRLRKGQDIDGWLVDEIREDELSLKRGRKVTRLSLRKDTPDGESSWASAH